MSKRDHRKTVNIDVGLPNNKKLKGASPATKWLDGRCGDCRYPSCGCECHSGVAA